MDSGFRQNDEWGDIKKAGDIAATGPFKNK